MNGFLGLPVAAADDDPFGLPPGTHAVTITKVEIKDNKDKTKKGLFITFSSQEDPTKNISNWNTLPNGNDPAAWGPDDHRALSFLKRTFKQLEIPESRMDSVTPDDLIGMDCVITVTEGSNGFMNVRKIARQGSPNLSPAEVQASGGDPWASTGPASDDPLL